MMPPEPSCVYHGHAGLRQLNFFTSRGPSRRKNCDCRIKIQTLARRWVRTRPLAVHRRRAATAACLIIAATLMPPPRALAQADGRPTQRPGRVTVDVFTNVTGEPVDAWIGTGIAASLAADLGATSIGLEIKTRWHVRGGRGVDAGRPPEFDTITGRRPSRGSSGCTRPRSRRSGPSRSLSSGSLAQSAASVTW